MDSIIGQEWAIDIKRDNLRGLGWAEIAVNQTWPELDSNLASLLVPA
jgi:hypothetical protein